MITVRLDSGQILTFPDDTPEEAIHAAAQHVMSGQADRQASVTGNPDFSDVENGTTEARTRKREQIRDAWKSGDLGHVPEPDTSGAAITSDALSLAGASAMSTAMGVPRQVEGLLAQPGDALRRAAGMGPMPRTADDASGPVGRLASSVDDNLQAKRAAFAESAQDLPEPVADAIGRTTQVIGSFAEPHGLALSGGLMAGKLGPEAAEMTDAGLRVPRTPPKEPLLTYDGDGPAPGFKGVIPDKLKELSGRPWRTYDATGESIPLEKPTGPTPMPREVNRVPLDMPIVGGSQTDQANIGGLWDYASRRYPRIASTVKEVHIDPHGGTFFEPETGRLVVSPDADLGDVMHEVTHAAQAIRGNLVPGAEASYEPAAVRAGEVYARVPQPAPRPLPDIVPDGPVIGDLPLTDREFSAAMADHSIEPSSAGYGGDREGRAFTAWMHKNGINPDHAGRYGELPELRDKFFELHNDPGPVGNYGPLTADENAAIFARGGRDVAPTPQTVQTAPATRGSIWKRLEDLERKAAYGEPIPRLPIDATTARPAGAISTEPLPLPRIGKGVNPRQVEDAWSVLSMRYPRLMGTIKGIEPITGTDRLTYAASMGSDNVLRVNPDITLTPDSMAHELVHRTQDMTGQLWSRGMVETPGLASVAEREAPAFRAGESFSGVGKIGVAPKDYSIYPDEGLAEEARALRAQYDPAKSVHDAGLSHADQSARLALSDEAAKRYGVDNPINDMLWERGAKDVKPPDWLEIGDASKFSGQPPSIRVQVPEWANSSDDALARWPEFLKAKAGNVISPEDLPFDPHGPLPLTRWQSSPGPATGLHFDLGDTARWRKSTAQFPGAFGGDSLYAETYTPKNPKIVVGGPSSADRLIDTAASDGHDVIININDLDPSHIEVIKTPIAGPGVLRDSPFSAEPNAPEMRWFDHVRAARNSGPNPPDRSPQALPAVPFRAFAKPPEVPPMSEDEAAAAMGWKLPDGAPKAVGSPIVTPNFQTNIAAQIGGPEGQRAADWITQNSDAVAKAIGPQQTWNTVEDMAARSGTTPEEFLRNNPKWNVLPPEERLRLTYVIKGNDMELQKLQAKLVDGSATDADKAEILRRIDTAGNLIKIGAKTGSEYGRALNTLKMESRIALGDDQLFKQSVYRKYAAQLDQEKPLMDSLARLDPNNPKELSAFIRSVNRPTYRQYVHEYWVNSILSSPVPFERKVIGDGIAMLTENGLVRPLAAAFDAARVKGIPYGWHAPMTLPEREVFLSEVPAAFTGLGRGIEQGFRRGMEVLRRGYDPETMTGELFVPRSALARSQNPFVREVIGPIVTAPVRLISAATTMARTMNFTAELYAQAACAASKEVAAGTIAKTEMAGRIASLVANPTDEIVAAASKFGAKTTFTDETSALGKAVIGLRDLPKATSDNPVIRGGLEAYRAGMGFMMPFVHIADRLLVRGLEYTPISAAASIGARNAGNYAEAANLAAKASIGSATMAYAASLAMQGKLTASAPSNPADRAAFYAEGKQPWSVKVGDSWVPFGHMQPLAMPFALVAAVHKGWTEDGTAPDMEKLGSAAAQVGAHITDQSYLQSMHKLMDVVSGSEQNAGRAFSDIAASTAFGFVPFSGMTRTVARAVDPRMIDAKTVKDKMLQNVPGASLGMVGKLTPWGEEDIPAGGRFRGVLASGTTLLPSQETKDPLNQELGRLGVPLGFVGNTISDKQTQGGKIRLTPDEHYVYQQSAGRASKLALQSLFATPGYMELDPETQRTAVSKAVGAARKYARMTVLMYHRKQGYPGLNPVAPAAGAGVDEGATP